MTDSTSIDALPTPNNINMNVTEQPVQPTPQPNIQQASPPPPQISQPPQPPQQNVPSIAPPNLNSTTINHALSDMQNNTMQLPTRDIPMETANIIQDEQVKPNYIPNENTPEYIEEKDTYDSMIEQNKKKQEAQDTTDLIYEELQFPVLVAVLYFLFQLPAVQKKFITYLPSLFNRDGTMSLGGYLTKSLSFGGIIYLSLKLTKQLSNL
jgi:hypothetical protein